MCRPTLMLFKNGKIIQWRKNSLFKRDAGITGYPHGKKWILIHTWYHIHKLAINKSEN